MTPGYEQTFPLEFLTVSQLMTAKRCLRRFFYQVMCRLEEPGGPHPALKFGEAIHAGIPYALQEGDIVKAIQAFDSVWAGQIEDEKHNKDVAKAMLFELMESHDGRKSLYTLVKPPESLRSIGTTTSDYELPFALTIPGLDIPLYGRIDGLAQHRDTGDYWVIEYKTSSENSERLPKQFQINPQVLTYVTAVKAYFKEYDVKGCFVETILKSKTRVGSTIHPIITQNHMLQFNLEWIIDIGNRILSANRTKNFLQEPTGCAPYATFGMPGYQCNYAKLCLVPDWTALRSFYEVGQQHLPFELPNTSQVKPASVPADQIRAGLDSLPMTEEAQDTTAANFVKLGTGK